MNDTVSNLSSWLCGIQILSSSLIPGWTEEQSTCNMWWDIVKQCHISHYHFSLLRQYKYITYFGRGELTWWNGICQTKFYEGNVHQKVCYHTHPRLNQNAQAPVPISKWALCLHLFFYWHSGELSVSLMASCFCICMCTSHQSGLHRLHCKGSGWDP